MKSKERSILEKAITPLLKQFGYKKSGTTWYYDTTCFVKVLNIQRSQWSKSYYINLGIYLKSLDTKEKPQEYDCHVRTRLTEISNNPNFCSKLLDFENEISEVERLEGILRMLKTEALPWLERYSNEEELSKLLQSGQKGLKVTKNVWPHFGLNMTY